MAVGSHWNTAILIYIVDGYFHTMMAKSSSYDRGPVARKAEDTSCSYYMLHMFSTGPLEKKLDDSWFYIILTYIPGVWVVTLQPNGN